MVLQRFRLPAAVLFGILALLGITAPSIPTLRPSMKTLVSAPTLLADDIALIMGGTGMPDPPQWYLDEVNDVYVQSNFPGYTPVAQHTPSESWPITGWMTGHQSVDLGVTYLHNSITQTYAGDDLLIFGVSQSALIASQEMRNLAANPPPGLGDLNFTLLGSPDNPMGGLFVRFAGLDIPGMDLSAFPPAPTNLFPTDIYSGQYDGVSDFPRYPLNLVSVLNAIAGLNSVHLDYGNLTAEQVASAVNLGESGMTDFYMIPTPILPLLQPLYDSSPVGKMMADYLQPMLKVIVDLGYGNLQHGLVADPGGVDGAGLIGFIPKVDPLEVLAALQLGNVQGTVALTNDLLENIGVGPLPDWVTDTLRALSGYDLTTQLDAWMLSDLTKMSAEPGMEYLNPATLFDGQPLIDGTEFIGSINQWIEENFGWLDTLLGG